MNKRSSMFCEHANECPVSPCRCDNDCGCRDASGECYSDRTHTTAKQPDRIAVPEAKIDKIGAMLDAMGARGKKSRK